MYTIDLATILQLLREFRRDGILQAKLPTGLPRLKQPCQVVIELMAGEVSSAIVKNMKGQTLLVDNEALQAVEALGKLNWVFDQSASVTARSAIGQTNPIFPSVPTTVRSRKSQTGPIFPPVPVPARSRTGQTGPIFPPMPAASRSLQGQTGPIISMPSTGQTGPIFPPVSPHQTRLLQNSTFQPQVPAPLKTLVPHRLMNLSQEEINRWPLRHRQVFVLIDGQRSRERIATILVLPLSVVSNVLQELQSLRIIEMRSS